MTITEITTLITSLASLAGVIFLFFKLGIIEKPGTKADVAQKYQNIAATSADREASLLQRIGELEARVETLEAERDRDKMLITELETYNKAWEAWADEVLRLLERLNVKPTIPKPTRKAAAQ